MKRFLKFLKRVVLVALGIILVLAGATWLYLRQPQFGALPKGERLERVKKSPNYRDGAFRNLVEKPTLTEGYTMMGEIWNTVFKDHPRRAPLDSLPSVKTNLKSLSPESNVMVWFGHSSFFLQLDGVKILVDPVFSGKASPLPGSIKAYKGSDIYTVDDMPEIDYMLLSHDHYDHLDYETVQALKNKVKFVTCGLGAGAHYERWGYTPQQILEKDWNEKVIVKPGFTIFTTSTHHDSGRGFTRSQSLWLSFFIQSPTLHIYYSGDGGYDDRFKKITEKYGQIDWAIMECGQYNKAWQSVHELPEEVAQTTTLLKARNLLPVHHSKFTLAKHPWDEPLEKISQLSQSKPYRLATPMIGEAVRLDDSTQVFSAWWKNVR